MSALDCGVEPGGAGEVAAGGHRPDRDELGDLGELYRSLAGSLERIVRSLVHAPDPVIEEACQLAWTRLVHHRDRVHRENALGWLIRTATREALKLLRRGDREEPLEVAGELGQALVIDPGPAELLEQRDRLALIGRLPRRQQRLLWLRGLGLSYDEIALRECCTARTVERQLRRARTRLRFAEAGA